MKTGLCIGLNYKGQPYELPDCELDAANMADLMIRSGIKCEKLVSCSSSFLMAHLKAVVATRQRKTDSFYLYFSGHGTQVLSGEAICLYDDRVGIEALRDFDLREALDGIKGNKFLILDSCFSGGMDRAAMKPGLRRKYIPFDAGTMTCFVPLKNLKEPKVLQKTKQYNLFACEKSEVSYSTGIGGLFTNALRAAVANGKKSVKQIIEASAAQCKPDQHPNSVVIGGSSTKHVF